jgi:hypothetical protein
MQQPPIHTDGPTTTCGLINLESARQRFGSQKVNLLIEMMQKGDVLADALIQELETADSTQRQQLQQGISQGLQSLVDPTPAVQAFLESVERVPEWVEQERLQRGSDANLFIGTTWLLFSLGPGSLTHTYSSPSIASILVHTGNLTKMAGRRLMETGAWHVASILPDGLQRGADGYMQNIQVRLLHARVRATLLKRGWDATTGAIPINQVEMTRTWLDFTYVPFRALQKFGITFSKDELVDMYHFWQYIAYLLGIDERIYREIMDQRSAQRLLELIDSTMEGANEDSKALVQAMLVSAAELLVLKLPFKMKYDLVSALTRRFHGNKLADQLGVKRTWMSVLMPLLVGLNRLQRSWNRRSPTARRRAIEGTVRVFMQIPPLDGPTAYQRNASDPTQQDLPQVASVSAKM